MTTTVQSHSVHPEHHRDTVQAVILRARARKKRFGRKTETPLPELSHDVFGDPVAYGYGRVSTTSQYDKEESVSAQKTRAEMYHKLHLEPQGIGWAGFMDDGRGVSASKVPFMERPAGRELLRRLKPGDHIVFDKIDRMWRRVGDFCRITEWFQRNNITMHIVNMGGMSLNTSSPIGKIVLTMLASLAEAESEMTGQRIRDSLHNLRTSGKRSGSMEMHGTKRTLVNGEYVAEWDWEMRKDMAKVVHLRDVEHYTFDEIAIHFENRRRKKEGMPPMNPIVTRRWMTRTRAVAWVKPYWIEKGIQILNITDVCQLPTRADLRSVAEMHVLPNKEKWKQERKVLLAGRKSMFDKLK